MLVPPRVDRAELLDLGQGTAAEAAESLADLRRINRYLGGVSTLAQHLLPRVQALVRARGADRDRPVVVADMGTGSADLPLAVVRWARARAYPVRVIAVDLTARHLAVARALTAGYPEISLVQADVFRLPLTTPAADYVASSLLMHHFAPPQVVTLLRLFYAHARHGLVINDLDRHWLPWLGIKLMQPIFARSWITQFDAGVSVLRAYTVLEMRALCAQAGLAHARVSWHWPWRMAVVVER